MVSSNQQTLPIGTPEWPHFPPLFAAEKLLPRNAARLFNLSTSG